jgi:secondary thiamine-phosphate synthase enzyme
MQTLTVVTKSRTVAVDITSEVEQIVRKSGITDGLCRLSIPHTTAGLFVNEKDDPAVATDIMDALNRMVPHEGSYRHAEGNSDSHIKSVLVGTTVMLPVAGGWLSLGRWQGIFFAEFDGPRTRTVNVVITKT